MCHTYCLIISYSLDKNSFGGSIYHLLRCFVILVYELIFWGLFMTMCDLGNGILAWALKVSPASNQFLYSHLSLKFPLLKGEWNLSHLCIFSVPAWDSCMFPLLFPLSYRCFPDLNFTRSLLIEEPMALPYGFKWYTQLSIFLLIKAHTSFKSPPWTE